MKPAKEAKRFAKMFINVVGMEAAPRALEELAAINQLVAKSGAVKSLLLNPGFAQTEKEAAIRKIAEKARLSDIVVKFVIHLTENRVVIALAEIVRHATALYLERKRRAKAIVYSPVAIAKPHEERLKSSLGRLVSRDVDIEYVIDPSLLGGVLVKVGSAMYDSSVKGQLRLLKDELIKG